ncbi:small membrane protein [Erwinia sp. SLM-02]|nr:small membrane protein [uncultured Erwinia sp.]
MKDWLLLLFAIILLVITVYSFVSYYRQRRAIKLQFKRK